MSVPEHSSGILAWLVASAERCQKWTNAKSIWQKLLLCTGLFFSFTSCPHPLPVSRPSQASQQMTSWPIFPHWVLGLYTPTSVAVGQVPGLPLEQGSILDEQAIHSP